MQKSSAIVTNSEIRKEINTSAPINPIILGIIGSAYGVRGWLRIFSSTEEAENIFKYQPWFVQRANKWQPIFLESWKRHNQDFIVSIKYIKDRKTAMLMTNYEIMIDSSQLPLLDNGDYYWKDLIGCQVVTITGYQLGKIINLIETGSNDVLVVKDNSKDIFGVQERLIPFLCGPVIKSVNIMTRLIKVNWNLAF